MTTRRRFLVTSCLLVPLGSRSTVASTTTPIRIGLTAVILDQKLEVLRRWQAWLEQKLERPVQFVQRRRYREITELLLNHDLDAAWTCGYPYIQHRQQMRLLAIPSYAGDGWYHSLIIVHSSDESVATFEDLAGKRFVFSDPDSNSGFLYPQHRLRKQNLRAETFFSRVFFSWGHPNTVEAIAVRLGDAGAVDSYVWDMLIRHEPDLAQRTRIIERSPRFGFPPIVTMRDVDSERVSTLSAVLLNMNLDEQGRAILETMGLDGFIPPDESYFDGIERMAHALD